MGILIALITSTAAFFQTARAYHADKSRKGHWLTIILGLIVIGSSVWAAYYQAKSSANLKGLVNTEVQFSYDFRTAPTKASEDTTLTVIERVIPQNNMAKELHVLSLVTQAYDDNFKAPNESTYADQSAWKAFVEKFPRESKRTIPWDSAAGVAHRVFDSKYQLSRQDLDDMKHFRLRIYLVSAAWWKNVSGTRDDATFCAFLGSDISPDNDPYKISEHPPLHACPTSSEAIF